MTEHNYSVFCNQKQGSNKKVNANLSGNLLCSRTLKTPHLFYCSLLSEYMIYRQNIFELKSTSSLLNFDTKTEASTPTSNVIHDEFQRYPEFNKTKVWGRQIFIRYNMISGKKHQKPSKCCWFAFICTKTAVVTSLLRLLRKLYFLRVK